MKKIIAATVVGGATAASLMGAGTAQASTPAPFIQPNGKPFTQQELVVESGTRLGITVLGLGQAALGLPQLADVFVNGVATVPHPVTGAPVPVPPGPLRHAYGDAGIKMAVGEIVDAPQYIVDPLIEAVAISVPPAFGGGSDHRPELEVVGNDPANTDGAIANFRDTQLLGLRDEAKKQALATVDVAIQVRDSIQGNGSTTAARKTATDKKPTVRESLRATVKTHQERATKTRDAVRDVVKNARHRDAQQRWRQDRQGVSTEARRGN